MAAFVLAFVASVLAEDVIPGQASGAIIPNIIRGPKHDVAGPSLNVAGPLTISVLSSFGGGLYVSFGHDADCPTAINGPTNGPLGANTAGIHPSRWASRLAIGKDSDSTIRSWGSPVEASFLNGAPNIDVFYVQGYTIPITCSCECTVITGCNKPLINDGIFLCQRGSRTHLLQSPH